MTEEQTRAGDSGETVRSVSRALDLLALFDGTHGTRSMRELIDGTGLAKSTVVRLVATLEQRGLLWTRGDGRLTPGAGLLRWARLAVEAWQLPPEAADCLRDLSEASDGESARIYIRQGTSRVCIAQHEGTQQLRHIVSIGEEMPLWAGASSHVLLTGCSPAEVRRVAAASGIAGIESRLIGNARRAADQGWSVSHGERQDGVSALAAPVTDHAGGVVAAVALGGPTTRFPAERIEAFLPVLIKAAQQLSDLQFLGGNR